MTEKSPLEGDPSEPITEPMSSFKGESYYTNANVDDDQSKFEEEVDAELDPSYNPKYPPLTKWTRDLPKTHVIGESSMEVLTRSQDMQDKLNEFKRNKVWRLIPTPPDASVVDQKWVFRNKMDKQGNVIRNKARLVVTGYYQCRFF
ncbi:uncharacterized mitochondrial protein AtMg00820-like [Lactuca sativa]|uniref:uncharacterized mitochondrial protein AtMg00820-like n=1 Tax=Lactuca sativa TaxID=4236 RepID=UPI000CD9A897|nr:uncharacterized mitochondrial protein AtMg00820-like [Lactuca sativa]